MIYTISYPLQCYFSIKILTKMNKMVLIKTAIKKSFRIILNNDLVLDIRMYIIYDD